MAMRVFANLQLVTSCVCFWIGRLCSQSFTSGHLLTGWVHHALHGAALEDHSDAAVGAKGSGMCSMGIFWYPDYFVSFTGSRQTFRCKSRCYLSSTKIFTGLDCNTASSNSLAVPQNPRGWTSIQECHLVGPFSAITSVTASSPRSRWLWPASLLQGAEDLIFLLGTGPGYQMSLFREL